MADRRHPKKRRAAPMAQIVCAILTLSVAVGVAIGCSAGVTEGTTVGAAVASSMVAVVSLWKGGRES
jgi:hypothetical protein